jgi:beta-glucanase (GH16 family)
VIFKPKLIPVLGYFVILSMLYPKSENNSELDGWDLVWQDEFSDSTISAAHWGFDMGTGAPVFDAYGISSPIFIPEGFPKDNFSVQWDGKLKVDHTGKYTFYIIADDGVRFYLNDSLLIDQWQPQPATEFTGKLNLQEDQEYPIRIEYFEKGGDETMILGWESDSFPKSLIPSKNLVTDTGEPGLKGTYFSNKLLKLSKNDKPFTRIDKELNWVTGGGWGNNELQYYTNVPSNIRINNGKLIIEARKEPFRGSEYTSARIKTKNSWKYGRFEIRAKLPKGRGTWSALWALPTDWTYGNWPYSGEIDIVEHVGFNEGDIVGSVHTIVHAGDLYGTDQQGSINIPNACNEFNNYILEWNENELSVMVNNESIFRYAKGNQSWERWPFDQRFHLLFNIAVGGWWGGAKGVDNDAFPTKMEIDYVRVYTQK